MIDIDKDLSHGFQLETKGCLMLYKTSETGHHEAELAKEAKIQYRCAGLNPKDIQAMEPEVEVDVLGGVYFPIDCHLHPVRMMETLFAHNKSFGVKFLFDHEVEGFESSNRKVNAVITNKGKIVGDHLVVASGSWLELMTKN